MNVVGTIGQTGMTQQTDTAATGSDDSEFAQLLGGMGGDTTAVAAPDAAAGSAVSASLSGREGELSAPEAVALSDEMLALLAVPMTTPPVVPVATTVAAAIPALIATDAVGATASSDSAGVLVQSAELSVEQSAEQTVDGQAAARGKATLITNSQPQESKAAPATSIATDTLPDATTSDTANRSLSTQDLRWLRSGVEGATDAGRSGRGAAKGISLATLAATAAQAADTTERASTTSVVAPTQTPDLYQQLLQTTPMLAMAAGAQRERALEAVTIDSLSGTADVAALNTVSAQPAGTQLASDALPFDIQPRQQLHATVGTHQWATELGNKLTMMATKDTQSATLYMTPADMGPVQVRIDVQQNQASVWFTAEHAETRSALEQSLPRLREMFSAQGMSLTDAGVFGDRSRQQPGYTAEEQQRMSNARLAMEAPADAAVVRSISLSMLDAYA